MANFQDTKCDNLVDTTEQKRDEVGGADYEYFAEGAVDFAAYDSPDGGPPPAPVVVGTTARPPLTTTTTTTMSAAARPPPGHPGVVAEDVDDDEEEEVHENEIEVRDYFPETWLFDLVELDAEGNAYLDVEAPHTVTTWVTDAICTHEEHGLGISNATGLLVSQDFFVDVGMPYSVKRGEVLPVNVSIFSTVDRTLPIRLSLRESEAFEVDQGPSSDLCLGGKDNRVSTFTIRAKDLHEVNVTAEAKITDEASVDEGCQSAGKAEGFTDVVLKPIRVKPEGFPVEDVQAVFECKSDDEGPVSLIFDPLTLPDNLVAGSERAWVTVSGDIMAPSLSNLERLLKVPTGCGEQNMIGMAPNVYLMDYLAGTGKSEPEIEARAREHMSTGYQRQQKFRHPNGAYSVWGPRDKVGSLWLTSFVAKVFAQASRFVEIDAGNVEESVAFILGNQMEDGCFRKSGFVLHHDLGGTDLSVTSSALITLLEVKGLVPLDAGVVRRAVACVRSNRTEELYNRALSTYALSLYNEKRADFGGEEEELEEVEEAGDFLDDLLAAGNTSVAGQLFWLDPESKSRSVEITAYGVLSLVLQERLPQALDAIRWLATQRNALGGFVSTQDTVVALQAMSQYSLRVSGSENRISVRAVEEEGSVEHYFAVDDDNKLLLQQEKLVNLPTAMEVEVSGQGCYMVQAILRYNVLESREQKSFTLRASQSSSGELEVCAAYTGQKASLPGMVVIEVELLSGFAAVPARLQILEGADGVRKVDSNAEEGTVAMYFDTMGREERCWRLRVKREAPVEELKPAIVRVFEYYNSENAVSVEYGLAPADEGEEDKEAEEKETVAGGAN